jgi:hypothetical protein
VTVSEQFRGISLTFLVQCMQHLFLSASFGSVPFERVAPKATGIFRGTVRSRAGAGLRRSQAPVLIVPLSAR